jgi:cytochrome P450
MVLSETLRLRGPLPVNLPRISPGKVIGGHCVPAGTLISNLAYSTQLNEEFFPAPLTFDPDRWERPTAQMKAAYRPFSIGPRNCIGIHLAKVQILLTIATLYQRFDITVDPSTTEKDMFAMDRGPLSPQGEKLLVHLHKR